MVPDTLALHALHALHVLHKGKDRYCLIFKWPCGRQRPGSTHLRSVVMQTDRGPIVSQGRESQRQYETALRFDMFITPKTAPRRTSTTICGRCGAVRACGAASLVVSVVSGNLRRSRHVSAARAA
ncbi:hypothetical protein NDU88_003989 [Pleurodeles waltl]|uniref:Uncharacterized protein n=1 Tax=Pleurodeles waltl TaxID=8319 RepID=A0AAV7QDL1_PLEWA|nr:hypothetical protein NDU88_003989 [Pleurodeles waltl]